MPKNRALHTGAIILVLINDPKPCSSYEGWLYPKTVPFGALNGTTTATLTGRKPISVISN